MSKNEERVAYEEVWLGPPAAVAASAAFCTKRRLCLISGVKLTGAPGLSWGGPHSKNVGNGRVFEGLGCWRLPHPFLGRYNSDFRAQGFGPSLWFFLRQRWWHYIGKIFAKGGRLRVIIPLARRGSTHWRGGDHGAKLQHGRRPV